MIDHQLELLYANYLKSKGVSIDTRTLKQSDLFFGISGENFDGSSYARQALDQGASFAVVDNGKYAGDDRVLLVADTLTALQELAKLHRSKFQGKVLAITGSNGKTTTKELVREVLSQKYNALATQGNYNNHLGVPLTILQLKEQPEIAIIEMGANHVGEIAALCEIAQPTYGLITNIGQAHTDGFGGIDGVLRGKSELFDYLKKTNGVLFINKDDERLKHMTKRFDNHEVFPGSDVSFVSNGELLMLSLGDRQIQTRLTGDYNYSNVAAAIAVGRYFEVDDERIAQALEKYESKNQRSQLIKRGTSTIILDAYNANPDSMRVALKNLSTFDQRKVAILGDMNELSNSEEVHRQFGKELSRMNFDEVILVGEKIRSALEFLQDAEHFETTQKLKEYLNERSFQDSVILVKASRSMKLEEIFTFF